MPIKKSELYSSLWSSCDELRGGMDASQYKDYVLVLLFIKYVSDKYAGVPYAPITIPPGASFQDMVALKGKSDIGDQINKRIIAPLAKENKLSDMPDFNDAPKLGSGKEMVDRLTNLISIFENPALDFSKNRAENDDILGDAYEYLMRHFATESGKSKGQFYTPAEVSRISVRRYERSRGFRTATCSWWMLRKIRPPSAKRSRLSDLTASMRLLDCTQWLCAATRRTSLTASRATCSTCHRFVPPSCGWRPAFRSTASRSLASRQSRSRSRSLTNKLPSPLSFLTWTQRSPRRKPSWPRPARSSKA